MNRDSGLITALFLSHVDISESCWNWRGPVGSNGYGNFWINLGPDGLKKEGAHRAVIRLSGVKIKKGLCIDHMCKNKLCVNPEHLRVVTRAVNNVENHAGIGHLNKTKSHCKRGHFFSEVNTRINSVGSRQCRICDRIRYENRK